MTSITERPRIEPAERVERRAGPAFGVWVLAIAVAGLAAWVIYDQVVESRTAVTSEVEALMGDYTDAWNEHDGEAFLALVTSDYEFVFEGDVTDATMQSRYIDGVLAGLDWQVESVGEPIMYGDGPWYLAQSGLITATGYPAEGYQGMSLFTIVEEGSELLIESHIFVGSG